MQQENFSTGELYAQVQDAGAALANKLVPAAHAMQTSGVPLCCMASACAAMQLRGWGHCSRVANRRLAATEGFEASSASRHASGKGIQHREQRRRQVRRLLILMASRGVSWRIWGIRWSSRSRPWLTAGQHLRTQPPQFRVSRGANSG